MLRYAIKLAYNWKELKYISVICSCFVIESKMWISSICIKHYIILLIDGIVLKRPLPLQCSCRPSPNQISMRRNRLLHQNKRSIAVDKTVESGSCAIRIVWRESRNHSALVCRYRNTRLTGRPAIDNQNKFYRSSPLQKCQVIVSVRLGRSFTIDASLSAHDRRLTVHVRGSPLIVADRRFRDRKTTFCQTFCSLTSVGIGPGHAVHCWA